MSGERDARASPASVRIAAMRIVAIDASTEVCSVALGIDERWWERSEVAGQSHSELLLPMLSALLDENHVTMQDLDGVAFGAGPGSFTGLRIACGVAQGLAFGAELTVVGICTLEAIAETARRRHGCTRVIAALDARMREVYIAAYAYFDGRWTVVIEPTVAPPMEAPIPASGDWWCTGNAFAMYPALHERFGVVAERCDPGVAPSAASIGLLALPRFLAGEGLPPRDAMPWYVRHRVALTTAERAAGIAL